MDLEIECSDLGTTTVILFYGGSGMIQVFWFFDITLFFEGVKIILTINQNRKTMLIIDIMSFLKNWGAWNENAGDQSESKGPRHQKYFWIKKGRSDPKG